MITKFKSIKNLAVFQDFIWDKNVRDKGNNVMLFKDMNIFYGRNYSGKTTLSRIIRALETYNISDKYENPEFEICFDDDGVKDASQSNLRSHGKNIRVFNEDFIRDNLRFIANPDDPNITPFAILGGNASTEDEIKELKKELGENEEGKESGLHLDLKNAESTATTARQAHSNANGALDNQLKYKATDRTNGIKYKPEHFGDINYSIKKLQSNIDVVLNPSFKPLNDDEKSKKHELLKESANQDISRIPKPNIDLDDINTKAKELITKSISSSGKIEQLLKESILNRWVKEGRQLHKGKLEKCSFCGNDISEERWKELDSHFDEESEKLEQDIDLLIGEVDTLIANLDSHVQIDKTLFYSKFHADLDQLIEQRKSILNGIKENLHRIKKDLQARKDDLLNSKPYNEIIDNSENLESCWTRFENYRIEANEYTKSLSGEQNEAKRLLCLREVSDFVKIIGYSDQKEKIQLLKKDADSKEEEKKAINQKIKKKSDLIEKKKRLMNDEEKGALKVNEYLNNFFGHNFLTLKALKEKGELKDKKIRFLITRDGKKAYHLSVGECSLIAFCYFMAKLEDIETKGSKPIIWIDDPISSLDGNHIFFTYSLIRHKIVEAQNSEQLFISTHNLDFLKYLKHLPNLKKDETKKSEAKKDETKKSEAKKSETSYFLVSRENENSQIKPMPKYLKDYVTEFNFLFHQIHQCANADTNDENQHSLFYSFGNNVRKFLEAFLFYKYPNAKYQNEKLKKFFGNEQKFLTMIMIERISNEFSHLKGSLERGMTPIDIPEMKKIASFILYKIEEKDNEQYGALLESIGETKEVKMIQNGKQ